MGHIRAVIDDVIPGLLHGAGIDLPPAESGCSPVQYKIALFSWSDQNERRVLPLLREADIGFQPCAFIAERADFYMYGREFGVSLPLRKDDRLAAVSGKLDDLISRPPLRLCVLIRETKHNTEESAALLRREIADRLQFPVIIPVRALEVISKGVSIRQFT